MLLAIYLNDHLAGSTVARELARRAAASNRGSTYGPFLEALVPELAARAQRQLRELETHRRRAVAEAFSA
jgi:hypothetical protein